MKIFLHWKFGIYYDIIEKRFLKYLKNICLAFSRSLKTTKFVLSLDMLTKNEIYVSLLSIIIPPLLYPDKFIVR